MVFIVLLRVSLFVCGVLRVMCVSVLVCMFMWVLVLSVCFCGFGNVCCALYLCVPVCVCVLLEVVAKHGPKNATSQT